MVLGLHPVSLEKVHHVDSCCPLYTCLLYWMPCGHLADDVVSMCSLVLVEMSPHHVLPSAVSNGQHYVLLKCKGCCKPA